jgi:L-lactate dehydrogenase complex protein LldE
MIRVFWPELFHVAGDRDASARAERLAPKVREFAELVSSLGIEPPSRPAKIAYHHSCHMLRELGLHDEPIELLRKAGCEVVEWTAQERCCGFGGTFSVKQPETSVAMADDKIDSLKESDAQVLVGCDQSCLLHLSGRLRHRGETIPVLHLAEVLDVT